MTLEAYADTIIPGAKRWPQDRAVAGLSHDGGAVEAGAVTLLEGPEGGLAPALDDLATALNGHAVRHRDAHGLPEDPSVPAFVALEADERIALVRELTALGHPEQALWVGLAIFSTMAFDSAPHLHTADAVRDGHVGLKTLGFAQPDADGLWRFADHSYRRELAPSHPDTNSTGSLA
ncbi:DUF5987 family protein [Actinacidiphila yeochonensis]|uniref:DUF5987 family protein n=1 Tax=Actinacidiphila yeochonensis TaxID=89050 RepID=UPI000561A094|nr:DUF5987 family protein [Actinacidiphila yeochonensis]